MKPKRLQKMVASLAGCAVAWLLLASGLDCGRDVGDSNQKGPDVKKSEKPTRSSKTVFVQIGEREYQVDAKSDSISQEEIQSVLVDIAEWIDRLDWPEDRPILLGEEPDYITVTFPVPDEMAHVSYRSDYTLQILLDRRTNSVLRVAGGG